MSLGLTHVAAIYMKCVTVNVSLTLSAAETKVTFRSLPSTVNQSALVSFTSERPEGSQQKTTACCVLPAAVILLLYLRRIVAPSPRGEVYHPTCSMEGHRDLRLALSDGKRGASADKQWSTDTASTQRRRLWLQLHLPLTTELDVLI